MREGCCPEKVLGSRGQGIPGCTENTVQESMGPKMKFPVNCPAGKFDVLFYLLGMIGGSCEIPKKNANSVSKKDVLVTFPLWRQPPKF